MGSGFSLSKILNEKSKASKEKIIEEDSSRVGVGFNVESISVYNLQPSKENFYSMEDIADIKDSIELIGVQQNLVVRKIPDTTTYKIIAGHRRWTASLWLTEEGKPQFEYLPCKIEMSLDEIKEQIILIYTNSTTRQLSDWEKVEQLVQLKELLKEYKKTHDLPGRVREMLAETLNVSVSQVSRIESIHDNLTEEFKNELKHNNINFSTAAELSRLSVEDQKAAYEQHQEKGSTNLKDIQAIKEKQAEPVVTEEIEQEHMEELQQEPIQITPTIQALKNIKELLENEISKHSTRRTTELQSLLNAGTVHNEYMRILREKVKQIEDELFEMMGDNLFDDEKKRAG